MHEYSIVQALYDRVASEAQRRGATAVHRLEVRLGELSGVDAGLLDTAWRTFRERTLCDGAPLDIEVVPARWVCSRCSAPIVPGGALVCSACRAPARLDQGDEILLARIEMEVGDV
jgi:hydrogenase nickel insertion protein HypA